MSTEWGAVLIVRLKNVFRYWIKVALSYQEPTA
jgi:hypothetical protein